MTKTFVSEARHERLASKISRMQKEIEKLNALLEGDSPVDPEPEAVHKYKLPK